ncbi:MAG: hypothetical protein Q9195_003395 [Heterodermia aff. obscurata]
MEEATPLSQPMNVEQIVKKAQCYEYNPLIALKYWLRTAGTLLKEAEIYEHEGNDQQTYLLLYRHAQLVVENLSKHPDARHADNRLALTQAKEEVQSSLKKLEILKPRINKRYERFEQLVRDRDARIASESVNKSTHLQLQDISKTESSHRRLPSDPAVAGSSDTIVAGENRDLAVKLAHDEIRRRAIARKATRQAGISEEVEHERRTAGLWGDWETAFAKDDQGIDPDTLGQQMRNALSQVNGPIKEKSNRNPRTSSQSIRSTYRYPTIPTAHDSVVLPTPTSKGSFQQATTNAPSLPPKYIELPSSTTSTSPKKPAKEELAADLSLSGTGVSSPAHSNTKAPAYTFKPSAYLENGTPLRTIWLPPDLRHRFLSLAYPNTQANLETCGILCGTLISNALFISKLVIPDQESTSDTCETINEGALFDFVDGEDLMVLGWIHTHPSQTCFMSSRDLHTHAGYQMMMPESIAIVCAPSKGE